MFHNAGVSYGTASPQATDMDFLRIGVCLVVLIWAQRAPAQHGHGGHHGGHHGWHHRGHHSGWDSSSSPYSGYATYVTPVVGGATYPIVAVGGFGGHHHHHHYTVRAPIFVSTGPVLFPPVIPAVQVRPIPTVSVSPVVHQTPVDPVDPAKRPAKPSSPAARLKSLDFQTQGDVKLRKHQWALAYMSYRSAIDAAGDRGEARFRQGFNYTAMQHYSSAVREFKRGLFLDKELPDSGIRLGVLFGPGSEIIRTSILHKVADWLREDPRDPDRLFLMGLFLHYEDDPRCRTVLNAARLMAGGDDDHIVALLCAWKDKPAVNPDPAKPPLLPDLPPIPEGADLPLLDAGLALAPGPVPLLEPPAPKLPMLLDRPVPLVPPVGPPPRP